MGGAEGHTSGRLRYVPIPGETQPKREGPAAPIAWGTFEPAEEMPRASLVPMNRERELGLDRRETG